MNIWLNGLFKDFKLANTSKAVIINETGVCANILKRLVGNEDFVELPYFNYARIEVASKFINAFECSADLPMLFLSERCVVVLTFSSEENKSTVASSIMTRLLGVLSKVKLPNRVMMLGLGTMSEEVLKDISDAVLDEILKLENLLQNSFEK